MTTPDIDRGQATLLARIAELQAEVERLRGPFRCCEHCADDVIHDVEPDKHSVSCQLCDDRAEAAERALADAESTIAALCDTASTLLAENLRWQRALSAQTGDLEAQLADERAIRARVEALRAEYADDWRVDYRRQGVIADLDAALVGPTEPEASDTGVDA